MQRHDVRIVANPAKLAKLDLESDHICCDRRPVPEPSAGSSALLLPRRRVNTPQLLRHSAELFEIALQTVCKEPGPLEARPASPRSALDEEEPAPATVGPLPNPAPSTHAPAVPGTGVRLPEHGRADGSLLHKSVRNGDPVTSQRAGLISGNNYK